MRYYSQASKVRAAYGASFCLEVHSPLPTGPFLFNFKGVCAQGKNTQLSDPKNPVTAEETGSGL